MSSDPTRRRPTRLAYHFARHARVMMACIIAGFGVAASAPVAMAQVVEDARPLPPTPGKKEKPTVILYYLVLVVLLALVFGANAVPAKRGHQD